MHCFLQKRLYYSSRFSCLRCASTCREFFFKHKADFSYFFKDIYFLKRSIILLIAFLSPAAYSCSRTRVLQRANKKTAVKKRLRFSFKGRRAP